MSIRFYRAEDLPLLYRINQAAVPGVGAETEAGLQTWLTLSTCFVACDPEDLPIGFITLMPLGLRAYTSPNMRWFESYAARTSRALIYVDRIAVRPDLRGQGIGDALYHAAFEHCDQATQIGCEVNVLPPTPGSHRFHTRLGFHKVGEQVFVPGAKSVAYYVRDL